MAYTAPTAAELKAAFPAFAAVDDSTVDYWITRANRSVDQTWTEADYTFAIMLLACHMMTINGLGTGAAAEAAAAGASGFKIMRSGALTLERFDNTSAGASAGSGYDATSYGQQFYALLRVNRGGARVTPTGTVPFGYPYQGCL